jgi:membrane fusion protein (multidrug efflux system)
MPTHLTAFCRALMLTLATGLPAAAQQARPAGPTKAGYIVAAPSSVPVTITLTGRALAQNATQVRPRVGGAVTAILYAPGTRVEAGTPLFSIDPLTYEVALSAAEAEKTRAEADYKAAKLVFDRAERLQGSATTRTAFEDAQTALLKSQATLGASESALRLATAQLDWATIRAPITGIVGVPQVSIGDLVTQNQTEALTEIVQVDPIHVDLTEPYPTRLRMDARAAAGEVRMTGPDLTLVLDDGRRITGGAKLISTGATVSTTTGTRTLRFEVANNGALIAPGMFLHGELQVGETTAILVPQRAAQRQRDGTLTAWLAVDGKARKQVLTESGNYGNAWVVIDGLKDGDQVLIDGTTNLRDGQDVDPVLAQIDENGVVQDAAPTTAGN